jgi:hypothetical protein
MARTRRRSMYRKSKRWNPKARRGRGRRRNCNPRAKAGYVGLNRAKFRRKTIWNMARRGKRTFKHLNPRGRRGSRRRNPSGTELRDGTAITISGDSVTLSSPYGETYEYDGLSSSALKALRRAKTFGQASRIASSGGVTRSINPRRRGKSRRSSKSRSRSSKRARRSSRRGRRSYARR